MALTTAAIDLMLTELVSDATICSLHDDDPGTDGSNELDDTLDAPYERQTIAWGTPSGGSVAQSGTAVFDLPSGVTAAYVGLWSTDGLTFYGTADVDDEVFASSGSLTVQNASLSGA